MPQNIIDDLNARSFVEFHEADSLSEDALRDKVLRGDYDLVVLFEEYCTTKIANYDTIEAPKLEIIFNVGEQKSTKA